MNNNKKQKQQIHLPKTTTKGMESGSDLHPFQQLITPHAHHHHQEYHKTCTITQEYHKTSTITHIEIRVPCFFCFWVNLQVGQEN